MSFYSANNTGINDLNLDQLRSIISDNRQPSGYLSRAELALALTNKDCVGIRVYKIGSHTRNRSSNELIVCGVLENGFDAPEENIGFLTEKKDTIFQKVVKYSVAPEEGTISPEAASMLSRRQVEAIMSNDTPLLAYFSLAMLNHLLIRSRVTGILLYEADLTSIRSRVPHLSVPDGFTPSSYVAFAAEDDGDGKVGIPHFFSSELHVLSDLPCPGHCLKIDPKGIVSTSEMVAIQSRFDENPYPMPWDNDNRA